jgi:hypothetical protein
VDVAVPPSVTIIRPEPEAPWRRVAVLRCHDCDAEEHVSLEGPLIVPAGVCMSCGEELFAWPLGAD